MPLALYFINYYLSWCLVASTVKPFRKTVRELFGIDRRERRGTFILSLMLAVLLLVRLVAFRPGRLPPELPPLQEDNATMVAEGEPGIPAVPFTFDPNTAGYDDLIRLGLTERQARTLVNYRNSGARFRRPEDLQRVYGIDPAMAARLIPYIIIEDADGAAETVRGQEQGKAPAAGDGKGKPPEEWIAGGSVYRPARSAGHERVDMIDLNLCCADELERLPGIGPVLAARIIRYRSLLGGFVEPGQMAEVYGLDSAVARMVKGNVMLTFDSVRPLVLDSITFGDLARHPYLGYEAARQITRYRAIAGGPVTLGEMVGSGVITPAQAGRIAPYVRPPQGVIRSDYEFISSKVLK